MNVLTSKPKVQLLITNNWLDSCLKVNLMENNGVTFKRCSRTVGEPLMGPTIHRARINVAGNWKRKVVHSILPAFYCWIRWKRRSRAKHGYIFGECLKANEWRTICDRTWEWKSVDYWNWESIGRFSVFQSRRRESRSQEIRRFVNKYIVNPLEGSIGIWSSSILVPTIKDPQKWKKLLVGKPRNG